MHCSMLDHLSPQKAGERLRTALDAGGEWLPEVLREADSLLTKMRLEGHADAAGLVIALDQFHARKIAQLLKVITNETPTVAISDEDDSSREIHRFAARGNHKRWIVAVRMISEGVDIPRLRGGRVCDDDSQRIILPAGGRQVRANDSRFRRTKRSVVSAVRRALSGSRLIHQGRARAYFNGENKNRRTKWNSDERFVCGCRDNR